MIRFTDTVTLGDLIALVGVACLALEVVLLRRRVRALERERIRMR